MDSVRTLVGSAAAAMLSTAAYAADLGPPPMQYQAPAPVSEQGGWYLRGDIGVGIQSFSSFDLGPASEVPASWAINQQDIQDTTIFGMGAGYVLNNWLRFDVTGEYRSNAHFHGQQVAQFGAIILPDDYNASKNEVTFLANAYIDLGTWWCVTPFIGAGIGGSYNTINSFTDVGASASVFPYEPI